MKKKLGVAFLSLIVVGVFAIGFIAPQAKAATTAELQAQIQSLLAQVQQLQTLLSQQGGQVAWCHNFNSNLKIGDTNQEVTALQTALQKEGLLTKISGEFDEETASVVTGFQEKYASEILTSWGLKYGTGFVGASTRAKLNKLHGCVVIPPVCAQSCPLLTPTMLTCAFGYKQVCETLKPNTCGCYPPPSCKCVPISENQPPVISGVSGPTALKIGETGTWTVQASDPEQGVLTYSVVWGDEGVYAISTVAPQSLTYTQTATFTHSYREAVGVYTPTFTVTDNSGLSAKTSVNVNVGGVIVPTITSITPSQGTVNTIVTIYGTNLTGATEVRFYNTNNPSTGSLGNISVSSNGSSLQFVLGGLLVENVTGTYQIRVVTPSGTSNALPFTITAPSTIPSITVLSPNGGEKYSIGQTVPISISTNIPEKQTPGITLQLYRGMPGASGPSFVQTIISNWAGGPSYSWIIPTNLAAGQYTIYASALVPGMNLKEGGVDDFSDATFSIVATTQPSLSLSLNSLSPSVGNVAAGGIDIPFMKFNLSASGGDVSINQISVGSDITPDNSLSAIKIYDGSTLIGSISSLSNSGNGYKWGSVNTSPITILKGSTKTLTIGADLNSGASGSLRLGVVGFGYSSVTPPNFIGNMPLYGNIMSIVASVNPVSCNPGQKVGDVNGDGKVDATDTNLAYSIYLNTTKAPSNLCCVDLNKDGVVTMSDVALIQRIANGLDKSVATCLINSLGLQETESRLANISAAVAELAQRIKEFLGR